MLKFFLFNSKSSHLKLVQFNLKLTPTTKILLKLLKTLSNYAQNLIQILNQLRKIEIMSTLIFKIILQLKWTLINVIYDLDNQFIVMILLILKMSISNHNKHLKVVETTNLRGWLFSVSGIRMPPLFMFMWLSLYPNTICFINTRKLSFSNGHHHRKLFKQSPVSWVSDGYLTFRKMPVKLLSKSSNSGA